MSARRLSDLLNDHFFAITIAKPQGGYRRCIAPPPDAQAFAGRKQLGALLLVRVNQKYAFPACRPHDCQVAGNGAFARAYERQERTATERGHRTETHPTYDRDIKDWASGFQTSIFCLIDVYYLSSNFTLPRPHIPAKVAVSFLLSSFILSNRQI